MFPIAMWGTFSNFSPQHCSPKPLEKKVAVEQLREIDIPLLIALDVNFNSIESTS